MLEILDLCVGCIETGESKRDAVERKEVCFTCTCDSQILINK